MSTKVQKKTRIASGTILCPSVRHGSLQRQVEPEEEEPIQAKQAGGQMAQADPDVGAQIRSLKGGGQPLPPSVRDSMEPKLGHDFGRVRVHTDTRAAEMAKDVGARAFTVGQDVVFGAGQYEPGTVRGSGLLAHELTHVAQQRPGLVQRKPEETEAAPTPETEVDLGTKIAEAEGHLKNKEFVAGLKDQVRDGYLANPTGGTDVIVEAIWSGPLGLGGVSVEAIPDKKARKKASDVRKKLHGLVSKELIKFFKEIAKGLESRRGELGVALAEYYRSRPSWDVSKLTDELWCSWLKLGPIDKDILDKKSLRNAQATWEKLKQEVGKAIDTYFEQSASSEAVAALDTEAVTAVKEEVDRARDYFVSKEDMDNLTDSALTRLSGKTHARTDSEWVALRQQITQLLIAAEAQVIRENIDSHWLKSFNEGVWGYARQLYVANIAKPIWLFYQEDIVEFSFLGHRTGKVNGVHKTVARALGLVDRSALRLAGVDGVKELSDRPRGYGFRFQPQKADLLKKQHLSYHAGGRAVDFRAKTNPYFRGNVQQLASVLGIEELYDLAISRGDLKKVASAIRPLMDRRSELLAELERYPEGSPEREKSENELKEIETKLDEINDAPRVKELREEAAEVHRRLNEAEEDLKKYWSEFTGGTGEAKDVDLEALSGRVAGELESQKTFLAELERDLAEVEAEIKTLSGKEKRARAKWSSTLKRDYIKPTKAQVKRLESLLNVLSAPEKLEAEEASAKKIKAAKKERGTLLKETAKLAESGLTDFPLWMVQAFTEQGWSWGGAWHEPMDAMHFDYMGPVEHTMS